MDLNNDGFIYFKLPKYLTNNSARININEIEITPCNDRSIAYINYKYNIDVKERSELDDVTGNLQKILTFDTGIVNILTGISKGLDNPIIYKGGYIMHINHRYKYLIEKVYYTALNRALKEKDFKKYRDIKRQISRFWRRREMIIKDHFNKMSRDVINKCKEAGIEEIIIGYNVNWKQNVNMGKKMNDQFYKIPYRELINMLKYKAEENNIKVIENEESYTSKTDAVNWETVEKHDTYSGKRGPRGLFRSAKKVLVNADVNGAINIMRKALEGKSNMLKELQEWIEKSKNICNPKVVKYTNKDIEKKEKKPYIKKERKGKKYYIISGLRDTLLKGKKKKMSKEEKNEIKARSLQDRILLY